VRTIHQLVALSACAKPRFDARMARLAAAVDADPSVPVGGVVWRAAPLKRAGRMLEKLALHPSQRAALEQCSADALDASGVLDAVRGMFLCSTMRHATRVLEELLADSASAAVVAPAAAAAAIAPAAAAIAGGPPHGHAGSSFARLRLCRLKNRFASPSEGGWMDCLVNVAMPDGVVCEVQIVHRQLLTVRDELGAHHSYGE
jgi:hypothetical protein